MKEKLLASIESEESIISCLLHNPWAITRVVDTLQSEHFYRDRHAMIYKMMLGLYQQGRTCTIDNVWDEIDRQDASDKLGLTRMDLIDLSESLATLGSIEDYAEIVIRKATMRRLAFAGAEITASAYAEDDDALEKAEKLIYEIAVGSNAALVPSFAEALDTYIADLEQRIDDRKNGVAQGVPIGLIDVDRTVGGLQPGGLYTLAALTGLGKTAFALNVALNVVQHAKHVLFFSLEMRRNELVQRILSMEACVDQSTLRDADVDSVVLTALKARARALRGCNLDIDDQTFILPGIKSRARQVHARKKLDVIVIDYLQMIESSADGRAKHETRAEEVAKLSREMKRLACELDIPILILAQLNRDVDKRATKDPQLSDINESGGIARDSDVVMFIYATQEELDRRAQCLPHQVTLKVAKNRNGRVGEVNLVFSPRITKFKNLEVEGLND
jgi:replicative DNA helicase